MKKYLLRASGIAAMAILLSSSVFAQSDEKDKDKEKDKNKGDEVIVITKKGNKDAKVTIEVRDGDIMVNGKPLDEYKGDDITVRRSRALTTTRAYSPFRVEGQTWNGGGNFYESSSNTAYLGVVTEKSDDGAKINSVSDNSAADKAGLKEGDVITRIDETRIDDHDDLTKAIRKHKPEDKINITYLRDGKEKQVAATLGKTNSNAITFTTPNVQVTPQFKFEEDFNGLGRVYSYSTGRVRLGIRAQDTEDGKGAKVLKVDDESPADKAGIREGDIITSFEGKDVNDADDLAEAARSVKDQSSMTVKLQRDGRSQTVEVKVPKKLKTTNL